MKQIQIDTSMGAAEALKDKNNEPWEINYPWGAERFYGTEPQVRARMSQAIAEYEKAEADGESS